ncbi:MAG: hypothetical protein LC804_25305 [Acidobacteria bacterium]|nr:hypothetical protein [Acidobacteriota bacterium]
MAAFAGPIVAPGHSVQECRWFHRADDQRAADLLTGTNVLNELLTPRGGRDSRIQLAGLNDTQSRWSTWLGDGNSDG